MKDTYYVVFNRNGIDRFLRTDRFELKSGEYAVQCDFEVPDELFAPVSIPKTRIVIPIEAVRRTIEASLEGDVEEKTEGTEG